MHESLDKLIGRFREAQDLAVKIITEPWKIPRPNSSMEWLSLFRIHSTQTRNGLDGVRARPHGIGVELKIDNLTIDFDWGKSGEPDGFDAWRLHWFDQNNGRMILATVEEIQQWIDAAVATSELIRSYSLYFDPNRRAPIEDPTSHRRL